ncbi:DUF1634 domain-containing protein [Elizabethkingia argentiflava]|uniref:DUF1634 domain-containing protein n=1 Tax=Elizabethkingia argenteiflava TaxID=2681556 RepID=A0A845PX90_9FLAO|nr:DUF1634 domain-containing protein [Elizabethkingia argenteiflava]NAW51843.1 DUF1634 domain-containing protein [Elizabethkingia argenteiflava]
MKKYFSQQYWKDQDIQLLVGKILRAGVSIASLIVLVGGIMYLISYGGETLPDYSIFKGESIGYTNLSGIFLGVFDLKAVAVIQLGVVALLATPIFRVFFSLIGFLLEKDRLYIVITVMVLGIIFFSIFSDIKA